MTALVDTGVFFAFYSLRDKHHYDAVALLIHLAEGKWGKSFITNHILDETLNILKYKLGPDLALRFIEDFINSQIVSILYVDKEAENEALRLFHRNLKRRGFSYTDAVSFAIIRSLDLDYFLTFDERSFRGLIDNILGPGYWDMLPKGEKMRIKHLIQG